MKHTLNGDQFLKDLEYLVNTDSQSSDPEGVAAVSAFFEKGFAEIGWKVEKKELDPTAGPCLKITNGEAPYDALLLGHMDTVFPRGTAAERPFRRDERAYGPGVNDMKGAPSPSTPQGHYGEQGSRLFLHCLQQRGRDSSRRARPWIEELPGRPHGP